MLFPFHVVNRRLIEATLLQIRPRSRESIATELIINQVEHGWFLQFFIFPFRVNDSIVYRADCEVQLHTNTCTMHRFQYISN